MSTLGFWRFGISGSHKFNTPTHPQGHCARWSATGGAGAAQREARVTHITSVCERISRVIKRLAANAGSTALCRHYSPRHGGMSAPLGRSCARCRRLGLAGVARCTRSCGLLLEHFSVAALGESSTVLTVVLRLVDGRFKHLAFGLNDARA